MSDSRQRAPRPTGSISWTTEAFGGRQGPGAPERAAPTRLRSRSLNAMGDAPPPERTAHTSSPKKTEETDQHALCPQPQVNSNVIWFGVRYPRPGGRRWGPRPWIETRWRRSRERDQKVVAKAAGRNIWGTTLEAGPFRMMSRGSGRRAKAGPATGFAGSNRKVNYATFPFFSPFSPSFLPLLFFFWPTF